MFALPDRAARTGIDLEMPFFDGLSIISYEGWIGERALTLQQDTAREQRHGNVLTRPFSARTCQRQSSEMHIGSGWWGSMGDALQGRSITGSTSRRAPTQRPRAMTAAGLVTGFRELWRTPLKQSVLELREQKFCCQCHDGQHDHRGENTGCIERALRRRDQ